VLSHTNAKPRGARWPVAAFTFTVSTVFAGAGEQVSIVFPRFPYGKVPTKSATHPLLTSYVRAIVADPMVESVGIVRLEGFRRSELRTRYARKAAAQTWQEVHFTDPGVLHQLPNQARVRAGHQRPDRAA